MMKKKKVSLSQVVNQDVESPRSFANILTNARYLQADRLKVSKKEFHYTVEGSFASGQLSVVEKLLDTHHKNRYLDVDSFIGDLHILYAKFWEDQHKLHPTIMPKRSLEEVIEFEMELDKQKEGINGNQ